MFGFRARTASQPIDAAVALPLDRLIDMRLDAARGNMLAHRGITQMPGLARTRLRGHGLDFDELRPYAEGDDVRHIDWNVTARIGRPHTRLYREERERAVTVAVDFRPGMFTGSGRLKSVAAGEYAAAILWQVAANRDRAAALVFDGLATTISRPASRQRGVLDALGVMASIFEDAKCTFGDAQPRQPLSDTLRDINRLPRASGLTLLLTDASDLGSEFDAEAGMAARRERLAVVRLVDPLELTGLPAGRYAWKANGQGTRANIDVAAAMAIEKDLRARNAALERRFIEVGLPVVTVPTDTPPGEIWTRLAENGIV